MYYFAPPVREINQMKTRHVAASIEGVVQLIAASFLRHGYFWYITGVIPEQKQTPMVDAKLIAKFRYAVGIKLNRDRHWRFQLKTWRLVLLSVKFG